MKRLISVFILALLLSLLSGAVLAQDDEEHTINYGDTVVGEITNRNFEIPYTFSGDAGDVIIIEMAAVETLGNLDAPSVILLDSEYEVLGATDGYSRTIFAAELPSAQEYTILATRRDGRSGDSVGDFTLSLYKPIVLELDQAVQSRGSSEQKGYYVVKDMNTFHIQYQKITGELSPAVSIMEIERNGLNPVVELQGDALSDGIIGVSVSFAEPFVITVGEALWDFNFQEVFVEYEITLKE